VALVFAAAAGFPLWKAKIGVLCDARVGIGAMEGDSELSP
jgi:hypothetical protein